MLEADPEEPMPDHDGSRPCGVSRRSVLRGAGVAGLGAPLLAACGAGDGGSGGSGSGDGSAAEVTVDASDVPVGGGTILEDELVVVTQPTEGEFLAFSAVCTHQGCPVQSVTDGEILCNCHGSRFSIADGSVVAGPADAPLESRSVNVDGDSVTVS